MHSSPHLRPNPWPSRKVDSASVSNLVVQFSLLAIEHALFLMILFLNVKSKEDERHIACKKGCISRDMTSSRAKNERFVCRDQIRRRRPFRFVLWEDVTRGRLTGRQYRAIFGSGNRVKQIWRKMRFHAADKFPISSKQQDLLPRLNLLNGL